MSRITVPAPSSEHSEVVKVVENLIAKILNDDVDLDDELKAIIISLGPDFINHPNAVELGYTLLHAAYVADNSGLVNFLLEQGADLEARDELGETPIMKSHHYANASVAKRTELIVGDGRGLDGKDGLEEDSFGLVSSVVVRAATESAAIPQASFAQNVPNVNTMLSDEEMDLLMSKWLPQEVEYIPMTGVADSMIGSSKLAMEREKLAVELAEREKLAVDVRIPRVVYILKKFSREFTWWCFWSFCRSIPTIFRKVFCYRFPCGV